MNRPVFRTVCIIISALLLYPAIICSQELNPVKLLKPQLDKGMPLMQALNNRKTSREFSSERIPLQVMSDLLWAAFGINRPESEKRTAPSAVNRQEIDIYIANADGLYLYDAKKHIMQPVLSKDIRAVTGTQSFVKDAAVNLIFVADYSKLGSSSDQQKEKISWADTGFISQNVYLFCASEGLATVVRGRVEREPLAKEMKLRPDQSITLTQTIGYPKK